MAIKNEIPLKDYFEGIIEGMEKGKKDFGINYKLIYCIIRTQTEEDARLIQTMNALKAEKEITYAIILTKTNVKKLLMIVDVK